MSCGELSLRLRSRRDHRRRSKRNSRDLFVLLFFGLAAVCGTVYVQALHVPVAAWWSGLAVGALATAVARVIEDGSLRRRLVTEGRERAAEFDVAEIAPRWIGD